VPRAGLSEASLALLGWTLTDEPTLQRYYAKTNAISPIRSASSASRTVPACDTTPVPSQVISGTVPRFVGCTGDVPLDVGRFGSLSKTRIPATTGTFALSRPVSKTQDQTTTATPGSVVAVDTSSLGLHGRQRRHGRASLCCWLTAPDRTELHAQFLTHSLD